MGFVAIVASFKRQRSVEVSCFCIKVLKRSAACLPRLCEFYKKTARHVFSQQGAYLHLAKYPCRFVSHFPPYYLCAAILITQVIFNGLILIVVWPWVYFAYRRVLTTLRAKYRGQEARTRVVCFFSSTGHNIIYCLTRPHHVGLYDVNSFVDLSLMRQQSFG